MDQDAQHLWIEDAGEIVCYLRVNPAGSRFLEPSLGRIVTKKSHRNRGYAEKLIKKAIDLVCEKESRAIRISAQCYLEKYYEKFGFIKASSTKIRKYTKSARNQTDLLKSGETCQSLLNLIIPRSVSEKLLFLVSRS